MLHDGWQSGPGMGLKPEADQKKTGSRLKENLKWTDNGLLFIAYWKQTKIRLEAEQRQTGESRLSTQIQGIRGH